MYNMKMFNLVFHLFIFSKFIFDEKEIYYFLRNTFRLTALSADQRLSI